MNKGSLHLVDCSICEKGFCKPDILETKVVSSCELASQAYHQLSAKSTNHKLSRIAPRRHNLVCCNIINTMGPADNYNKLTITEVNTT